jgi:hypothetical protein
MSELPSRPNLDQLRHQARDLLRSALAGEEDACRRISAWSDRVILTAAQFAIAREYGFASWRQLVAEVEGRRRQETSPTADALQPRDHLSRISSWSAGQPIALEGWTLRPRGIVIESGGALLRIALDSLSQSIEAEQQGAGLLPLRRHGRPRMAIESLQPCLDRLGAVDSDGLEYTLHRRGGIGSVQVVGRQRVPRHAELDLYLDPVPEADVEWIELVGDAGERTRLLRGVPADTQVIGPTPILGADHRVESVALRLIAIRLTGAPIAGQFLVEQCAEAMAAVEAIEARGEIASSAAKAHLLALCRFMSEGNAADAVALNWQTMLEVADLRDGLRPSADVAVSLPALDGVTVEVRTVLFEDDSWSLALRAKPDWWCYSDDGHQKSQPITFVATDDVGGTYAHLGSGGGGAGSGHDLSIRFRPRLAPAATRLRLLARASREQVEIDISLPLT